MEAYMQQALLQQSCTVKMAEAIRRHMSLTNCLENFYVGLGTPDLFLR